MKIGIDVREFRKNTFTGIRSILENFLTYARISWKHEFVLFCNQFTDTAFLPDGCKKVIIPEKNTFLWDQFRLPAALGREKIDVFFSPYIKTPFRRVCPYVNTVCDVIPLTVSKYKGAKAILEKAHFSFYSFFCSRRAAKVITLSEDAKDRVSRIFRIKRDKLEVVYPSVKMPAAPEKPDKRITELTARYDLHKPYILYLGNFKPHKNLSRLISAFDLLPEHVKETHRLMLVGGSRNETVNIKSVIEEKQLGGKIIPVMNLSHDDIYIFLKNASVLVFPSLAEGFGIPLIEAMAAGVPVAASNAGPMPEVLGEAAVFFDPYNVDNISETVLKLLEEEDTRKQCAERGHERAALFNPEDMAQRMLDILEGAGESASGAKALILDLGGVGNTILIYPLIRALKEQEKCEVKIIVSEKVVYGLLTALGFSDEEMLLLEPRAIGPAREILNIRKEKFDIGIAAAYTDWLKSWLFFSAAAVKRKVFSLPGAFSFLADKGVSDPSLHEYDVHKRFAEYFGLKLPPYPRIDIEGDERFAEEFFRENEMNTGNIIIGMHAGSGEKQAYFRRWPIAGFAALVDLAHKELNAQVILLGGSNERGLEEQLAAETDVKFASSVGKTDFHQLASLIRKCDVVVGNDSGIMHFAASLDVPVVAIFGPTDYRKTRPLSKHAKIVRKDLKCSPCYRNGRVKCKKFDCFSLIDPGDVFMEIKGSLAETGRLRK